MSEDDPQGLALRADAALTAMNTDAHAQQSGTLRRADYAWPAQGREADAQLAVEARLAADGTMTKWHYRARLDAQAEAEAVHAESAALPPLLYRHVQASIAVDDPACAIPSQAHAFARESFIDEIAHDAQRDAVALRLDHLDANRDAGAREVIRMVSERAAWGAPVAAAAQPDSPWVRGRGFAFDGERADEHAPPSTLALDYADKSTSAQPVKSVKQAASWSAWVVDLDVNRATGDIAVRRVVAGQGAGTPDQTALTGMPAWQIEEAIARATGVRRLARATHDETGSPAGNQPSVSHDLIDSPFDSSIDSESGLIQSRNDQDENRIDQMSAPAAAAIANALYDATGVRFRAPPFDPDTLRRAFAAAGPAVALDAPAAQRRPSRWKRWLAGGGIGGVAGGLIGLACSMLPGPASIAPLPAGANADASAWSAAMLERGRQIAIAGDCAVCHTAPGGATNAGGFALETPFGTVWSTNITPDRETGIGAWTYEAFARAMRQGIARDGRHLYPAFPYTSFARMSDADMMSLYAWLMSQPAVKQAAPETKLPFPMNQRRLVAGWNWLFHDDAQYAPDPQRSALWNRGKYLVDGAGHCGACHTPRNALGAEKGGFAYLAGGSAEGWDAPSLVAAHAGTNSKVGKSGAPVPWTEDALFAYLRTGFSPEHGVAAGPMAPVVAGLADLPESDVRAIAHYIASLSPPVEAAAAAQAAAARASGANADALTTLGFQNGQRMFEAACAVCHAASGGVGHFGVRPLMGLNTSVSHASPDNLLHVLMNGIEQPATEGLGYMPGFKDSFDDRQMAELAGYIRARYAPDEPAWRDLESASARVRAQTH
ncbi:cytochrome c [Paraburkholderia tropica]|uniref:c-type cytochrome n=2 Tax=Paraburkholderia tropica TaxID=92647 RepID=UPI0007ED3C11|nr:cytochrome c [Paraburkholderia tropica]MBB2980192.1 nicotinate dehydrogenase subunit B [Paraburkholderia tropica]OBR52778.1 cytochrome C [Paraburkholderia tropica]